jgi:hypothetical protein
MSQPKLADHINGCQRYKKTRLSEAGFLLGVDAMCEFAHKQIKRPIFP